MGEHKREYIHNLAHTIIGQIKINGAEFHLDAKLGTELYKKFGSLIEGALKKYGTEALGRISGCGISESSDGNMTMEEVHLNTVWLTKPMSGRQILITVATTTIIAAIADNLRSGARNGLFAIKIRPDARGRPIYGGVAPGGGRAIQRGPGLDGYDNFADRYDNGNVTPHQGAFGKYRED